MALPEWSRTIAGRLRGYGILPRPRGIPAGRPSRCGVRMEEADWLLHGRSAQQIASPLRRAMESQKSCLWKNFPGGTHRALSHPSRSGVGVESEPLWISARRSARPAARNVASVRCNQCAFSTNSRERQLLKPKMDRYLPERFQCVPEASVQRGRASRCGGDEAVEFRRGVHPTRRKRFRVCSHATFFA